MAYQLRRINPIDNQPNKAVGLAYPFNGNAVFNSTYDSRDTIKANLANLFFTGRGERFLNPGFGTVLRNLLFEQINDEDQSAIRNEISTIIAAYFPQIRVDDLIFEKVDHIVNFRLVYSLPQYGINDNLDLELSN